MGTIIKERAKKSTMEVVAMCRKTSIPRKLEQNIIR